jgi:hypothetical protein
MKNFIIVGAGPVGLWTAIQIKKRMPESNIILYERYTEYKRNHILKIQNSSLFFGASSNNNEFDVSFFKNVFKIKQSKIKNTPLKKNFISTSSIEAGLKSWALSLNCQIIYDTVESLDDLIKNKNKDTIFILANGANSSLRDELLGSNVEQDDLQYIIEMKTSSKLNIKKTSSKILNKLNNMSFEYIGHKKDDVIPFNLRLFISKSDYLSIPEASFKDPLKDPSLLPENIRDDLSNYAKSKGLIISDLFINGQISKLQLSVYSALKFSEDYKGFKFFFVGDTAMGVPYFRALNSGFVLGSRLAGILKHSSTPLIASHFYNIYRPVHKHAEFTLAKSKNYILNIYSNLRKLYKH